MQEGEPGFLQGFLWGYMKDAGLMGVRARLVCKVGLWSDAILA